MKYPLLMVHGMGFRDYKRICYWGRIPKALQSIGADIHYGGQDSNASVEYNANHLAQRIDKILNKTGAEKVNIIAHSKGGLETRYLISSLGYGDKIASLTTISTPHNGSKTVDIINIFPVWLVKLCCSFTDVWFRILGDKHPDTYSAIKLFTTAEADNFNANNPDDPNVYYQSYGFAMRNGLSDLFMIFPWLIVHAIEGDCDGFLTQKAVQWTNFRGICKGTKRRGISHCDEVDMRRHKLSVTLNGIDFDDITDLYMNIANNLTELGF